jgi:putative hydrolases of HD superfamily
MKQPDIHRVLAFQQLLLTFSQIQRRVDRKQDEAYIKESDTEHSYNLALTAWYLCAFFPKLDHDTVIRFSLVHDLVEVHAGDTHIFAAQEELQSKAEREAAAFKQLSADWPDFPDLLAQIQAYEQHDSEEAKFVYALDKIMPILQIYLSGGYTWKQENITPQQLHEAKKHKVAVSADIAPYYDELYQLLVTGTDLFN